MSTLYDLMLMLDADAPSERRTEIMGQVEAAIAAGGSLESKHDWGTRRLVYEIDHRTEAEYHLLQFTGAPALLESLQRMLKLTDGIVRARIIKVKPGTPPPPAVRAPEPPAPAAVPAGEADAAAAGEDAAPPVDAPAAPASEEAPPAETADAPPSQPEAEGQPPTEAAEPASTA